MSLHSGKTTDTLLKEAYELSKIPKDRELDVLLSSGEQIAISKLSILLNELGYEAISLTGWQAGIYTNDTNQNALIEYIDTSRVLQELQNRKIVIIAGFQGINSNLDITTLGRGGSDTTALAISAGLKAKQCYIFSDVDGVYTTDPNKYSNAKRLSNLSYIEMVDIANEGAKVLHHRCIEIGNKFNIPIIAKSTFNGKSGSIIDNKIEDKSVKSIVKNDDISLVTLKGGASITTSSLEIYNLLISNSITPIQFKDNNSNWFETEFLIKRTDINRLRRLVEGDLSAFSVTIKAVSRISIIGYSINTDTKILQKVINVITEYLIKNHTDATTKHDIRIQNNIPEEYVREIYGINTTNNKIAITFYKAVENDLLQELHKKLIEN